MTWAVLCFPDKEHFHVARARRCVGPFPTYEDVLDWTEKNNEHHWITLNLEEPK